MGGDVTGAPMLPDPPLPHALRSLGIQADETRIIEVAEVWWRVHRTEGAFVLAWNAFRTFGPLLRFDPHALPRGELNVRMASRRKPDRRPAPTDPFRKTDHREPQRPSAPLITYRPPRRVSLRKQNVGSRAQNDAKCPD